MSEAVCEQLGFDREAAAEQRADMRRDERMGLYSYDVDCDHNGYFSNSPAGYGQTQDEAITELLAEINDRAEARQGNVALDKDAGK